MRPKTILLVDDEDVLRQELEAYLVERGWSVDATGDGEEGLRRAREGDFDLVVTDIRLGSLDGLSIVEEVRRRSVDVPVVVISAHSTLLTAIEAFRRGASDYVSKPIVFRDLIARFRMLLEGRRRAIESRSLRPLEHPPQLDWLAGRSASIRCLLERVREFAPLESPVLLRGERGTGRSQVARAIHAGSPRRDGPFQKLRCDHAAPDLLERARAANGGTLFLAEIGRLLPEVQATLLRVIDEGRFVPAGSTAPFSVDLRVIASTSDEGTLRTELRARLAGSAIDVPTLAKRIEDIPELVDRFVERLAAAMDLPIRGVEPAVLDALSGRRWPGNVREMQNAIQRAMIACEGETISARDLPALDETFQT